MALDPRTPVIVGVGQQLQRIDDPLAALAPVPFIAEAIRAAASDAGLSAVPNVDSIRVVSFLSWRYRDPARFIADELGISTNETVATTMGGNSTQSLINATSVEIQNGDVDLVILCGGETSRTRKRARAANIDLPWPVVPEDVAPSRIMGEDLVMNHEYELSRRIVAPIQVYPMFETALRAAAGRDIDEHNAHLGRLWSGFSKVAAGNPYAWIRKEMTPEEIITTGPRNRMIGLPYTKVMNSNNDVDQSAAIIMCSVATAERLGIARDKWVFPIAGTDCHEHKYISERMTFSETPAVKLGGRLALELAETSIDEIDIVDLYSCFPSAVQLGAMSLGLALDRQLTRTGERQATGARELAVEWTMEQLRDARRCHGGGRTATAHQRKGVGVGQRWIRHQARLRCVLHHSPDARIPPRVSASGDRRVTATERGGCRRLGRSREHRGLHRDARS